ncbi:MAG: acyl dehydratase [Chloroflexi bacterium]|nr:acyl dehydratase [Chloroflexota bacterium]
MSSAEKRVERRGGQGAAGRVVDRKGTLYYEDVAVGVKIPQQQVELTVPRMIRWCGAAEIFSPDHIDKDYALAHGLPNMIGSGWWTQARLVKLFSDWVGESGWVWKVHHQLRNNLLPGQVLTFSGEVTGKDQRQGLGFVDVTFLVADQNGRVISPGNATVVLPLKAGRPVPYPFEV